MEDSSGNGERGRERNQEKIGNEKTKAIRKKQTLGLIESAKVYTHTHTRSSTHTGMEM